jgi:hypothetical protein
VQALAVYGQLLHYPEKPDLKALACAWFTDLSTDEDTAALIEPGFKLLLQADRRGFTPWVHLAKALGHAVLPVAFKQDNAPYYLIQTAAEQKRYILNVVNSGVVSVRHVQTGKLILKSPLLGARVLPSTSTTKLHLRMRYTPNETIVVKVVQSGVVAASPSASGSVLPSLDSV